MIDEPTSASEGTPSACPFVAFEDDRDHRSDAPDYRHRCFAAPEPEPRAFPHQERYCLGTEFGLCPVFLEWARQEAATVKAAGTVAGVAAAAAMAAEADAYGEEEAPAFLARPRVIPPIEVAGTSKKSGDATAGLWSYESESKRSPAPTAPPPPSALKPPAVAMASRRGPSHPGWENPPRLESFPRLRGRDDRRANQPLLIMALCVALIFVALITFPIVMNQHGPAPVGSLGSGGSGLPLPSVNSSPTPTPAPLYSFRRYQIRKGDYMSAIAITNNLKLCELLAANPDKDPNVILPGDWVNIPVPGTLACVTPAPSASK